MPVNPTHPGVYIQEIPSGVRTITRVATSITAFVGRAERGVVGEPTVCRDFGEFDRRFGGLWSDGPMSYAVDDFFANGGTEAMIVRLFAADEDDGITNLTIGSLRLRAVSEGSWGNRLSGQVSNPEDPASAAETAGRFGLVEDDLFDLTVDDTGSGAGETFRNITVNMSGGAARVDRVLDQSSSLVRLALDDNGDPVLPRTRPSASTTPSGTDGNDGSELGSADFIGSEDERSGIHCLLDADLFNLLCIPPDTRGGTLDRLVRESAAKLCADERAIFIVDPPANWDSDPADAAAKVRADQLDPTKAVLSLAHAADAALFFPRLRKRDPLRGGQMDVFASCGAVAGVIARTDASRGVWKAPAGTEAAVAAVEELTVELTDEEQGLLNPIAVNCLRLLPHIGLVVWGSRTLRGSDQFSDEFKYLPVRRLALFIEESLYRGTDWVVFEPNDEPLWAQIRQSVGAFMQALFRQGALAGSSANDSYFVKCDRETMTQDDIDRGIVNIVVGFAPLQPAEFVVISIRQVHTA
jgi:hypothetical protein